MSWQASVRQLLAVCVGWSDGVGQNDGHDSTSLSARTRTHTHMLVLLINVNSQKSTYADVFFFDESVLCVCVLNGSVEGKVKKKKEKENTAAYSD